MNKRIEILLHMASWVILFLLPFNFISRDNGFSLMQYAMISLSPVLFMIVFYTNFLWLTPHYFLTGRRRYYWLFNIVMVVSLGIALHFWMIYVKNIYWGTRPHHYEPTLLNDIIFILRDIFNFCIAAGVATTIVLSKRWRNAEQARRDAEAARTDAELSNLRSQINPHFLLNTLNNIYALTAFDTAKAQAAIQDLSKMLRYILYDNQEPTVPLKDEVEFIENYVKLMRIRLPQSVDVQLNVQCKNLEVHIAPMIIISLVENAFKHGVSPTKPSFIHIHIMADEHQRICDISNSNHPKSATDHSGHGIGLQQVQRRLDLAYSGRYSWERGVSDDGTVYHSKIIIRL